MPSWPGCRPGFCAIADRPTDVTVQGSGVIPAAIGAAAPTRRPLGFALEGQDCGRRPGDGRATAGRRPDVAGDGHALSTRQHRVSLYTSHDTVPGQVPLMLRVEGENDVV